MAELDPAKVKSWISRAHNAGLNAENGLLNTYTIKLDANFAEPTKKGITLKEFYNTTQHPGNQEHVDSFSGERSFISGKGTHTQRIEWF